MHERHHMKELTKHLEVSLSLASKDKDWYQKPFLDSSTPLFRAVLVCLVWLYQCMDPT